MRTSNFKRGLTLFWWVSIFFLYVPLFVIVLFSFNSTNSSAFFTGFSLRWYHQLFQNQELITAITNTLILGIISSVLALVVGGLIGYGMYRHRARRIGWIVALIYLPIVMPDIVFGISEMTFFDAIHRHLDILGPSMLTMILAHVTFQIPFVAIIVYSRLVGLDPSLFEAAKDLYASPVKRALHFLIPTLKPSLIAAFFLAFTLSIDDFVISFFNAGPENTTLPIYIWGAIRRGISPEINAIATLMIGTVVIAAIISLIFNRNKNH